MRIKMFAVWCAWLQGGKALLVCFRGICHTVHMCGPCSCPSTAPRPQQCIGTLERLASSLAPRGAGTMKVSTVDGDRGRNTSGGQGE